MKPKKKVECGGPKTFKEYTSIQYTNHPIQPLDEICAYKVHQYY